jgi:hypothetical protein
MFQSKESKVYTSKRGGKYKIKKSFSGTFLLKFKNGKWQSVDPYTSYNSKIFRTIEHKGFKL